MSRKYTIVYQNRRTKARLCFWMSQAESRWGLEDKLFYWHLKVRGYVRAQGQHYKRQATAVSAAFSVIKAMGGRETDWKLA